MLVNPNKAKILLPPPDCLEVVSMTRRLPLLNSKIGFWFNVRLPTKGGNFCKAPSKFFLPFAWQHRSKVPSAYGRPCGIIINWNFSPSYFTELVTQHSFAYLIWPYFLSLRPEETLGKESVCVEGWGGREKNKVRAGSRSKDSCRARSCPRTTVHKAPPVPVPAVSLLWSLSRSGS